ncbi:MAG TPA: hypothetical protein VIG86_05995 [Candidatus Dormibacteraeota bacterium]|jgi:hypothetical protein
MPPLFRRHTPEFAKPTGTLPCSERACSNSNGFPCAYRDRRGQTCTTAFCPDHRSMVGGVVYCRRHASTITALGAGADARSLPELENRGASLVDWMADAISDGVVAMLASTARESETVKTEEEVTVIFDAQRRRRWERSWKLIENTGVSIKVSLQVAADADDALVDARVGTFVVARGVPPWVTRRRAGVEVTSQVDTEQRELFEQFLLTHIAAEMAQQRADEAADRLRVMR